LKILHTSDWHLGQLFYFNDRLEEHRRALNWLQNVIQTEKIEVLIVAGDVFDITNPPNTARALYYKFLAGLSETACRHVVITGGNHDSPAMLNAPRDLLSALNIHVVGCISESIENEVITLYDKNNQLELIVAAVPYLRTQDLKMSIMGESQAERSDSIRQGIRTHYEKIADTIAQNWENYPTIPLIATGHLYAKGASASERQNNIYIGDIENIAADAFPTMFQYVALGHLHRWQQVGGEARVRYSGSIIPLSFSETEEIKKIQIIDFQGVTPTYSEIDIPCFRQLKTIRGNIAHLKAEMLLLHEANQTANRTLETWVEIMVENQTATLRPDIELKEYAKSLSLEILRVRIDNQAQANHHFFAHQSLSELSPLEVFRQKSQQAAPEEREILENTFQELLERMKLGVG
jgi:DNA repair protein SbcD/Mre11